jgi:hypothetical protein
MKDYKHTLNRIMVLKGESPAMHQLGNIGRDNDDYIRVYAEDGEYWVGCFEEGFGFIDVKFKKADCRNITGEEREFINRQYYSLNGKEILYKINVDEEGNLIKSIK